MNMKRVTTKHGDNRSERQQNPNNDEEDQLFVFGYSCHIFPSNETMPSEESRLISHSLGGEPLQIDRFDCRLHLSTVTRGRPCETENDDEDKAYDDERYREMYANMEDEKELKRRLNEPPKAEISFTYDDRSQTSSPESDKFEPYEIPKGFKLPVGVTQPQTMKEHRVIEKTAALVKERGTQMEIFIKAKQHSNEMFDFLDFENPMNTYYKVILKHMKEGRYPLETPKETSNKPASGRLSTATAGNGKASNALAAIALAHGDSDDSDDEGYLHPSLLSTPSNGAEKVKSNSPSGIGPQPRPSVRQANVLHPLKVPTLDSSNHTESVYKLLSSNIPNRNKEGFLTPFSDSTEYRQWFKQFYGRDYLAICRPSMCYVQPCHHNILSVIKNAVDYVEKYGARGEEHLKNNCHLRFEFLDPADKHFMYYQECLYMRLTSPAEESYEPTVSGIRSEDRAKCVPSPSSTTNTDVKSSVTTESRKRKCNDDGDEISDLLEPSSSSSKDLSCANDLTLQQQRKEKARRFMANILQQKLAEKHAASKQRSSNPIRDCPQTDVFDRVDSVRLTMANNTDSTIRIKLETCESRQADLNTAKTNSA